jgi:3-hydroxyacyl-[acyl-carrier-protein] dehydratase
MLTPTEILNRLPQTKPFRFVDEITSVDENEIKGHYTFQQNENFYSGHFPNNPVTPGVILLESMCQIGLVAFGIYLISLEMDTTKSLNWLTLFTDAEVEFAKPVYPGDKVLIHAKKIFWRRMKLQSKIEMHDTNGNLISSTLASGMGVIKQ